MPKNELPYLGDDPECEDVRRAPDPSRHGGAVRRDARLHRDLLSICAVAALIGLSAVTIERLLGGGFAEGAALLGPWLISPTLDSRRGRSAGATSFVSAFSGSSKLVCCYRCGISNLLRGVLARDEEAKSRRL